jgi:hypothetical protein
MALDLQAYTLPAIFVVSIVLILVGSELGRRLGARTRGRGDANDSTLEAAILGLLALMISFTFAMGLSRFEARRDAVLNEANAIGTTALRARLLPEPHGSASVKLLRDYVRIRLHLNQTRGTKRELDAAIAQSNEIQESLWQHAIAMAEKDSGIVPTGLFIQALNDMIDNQEKRLTALRNRVPNIVLMALYGIAIIANAFAAYGGALETRRSRLPVYAMGVLVAAVILLIQDLDRPGTGFIRVSQQPMIDTAASIASFSE